ncbi:MAG: hexose kinase [Planctomycetes bacterium]|nr:hexose kinase [Planctomycetota bacterium]
MILAVTLNPCVDRTIFVEKLELGRIIQGARAHSVAGGKGLNVVRLARRFGERADSFTVLGGHPGRMIDELSQTQDGIELIAVWTEAPTRDIVTITEEGTWRQAAFKEPSPGITPGEKREILATFDSIVERYDLIVLTGSSPCAETDDVYARMIATAKDLGKITILDSSGVSLAQGIEAAPFMVKPNLAETSATLGRDIAGEDEIWEAVGFYRGKGIRTVVLTDGDKGAYIQHNDRRWRVIPPTVKTINPVASGDALVAGMAVGLVRGASIEQTIKLGIACGAANAAMWAPAMCSPDVVARLIPQVRYEELAS